MIQHYICNQEDIQSKLEVLTKTESLEDGWTTSYLDLETKEKWILTRYNSENHGGGTAILKRLPQPTIEELIEIAITAEDKNNIMGASIELSERERFNKEDFRERLLLKMLNYDIPKLSHFNRERIKIIIQETRLYDLTNQRNIVGKHFTEIQTDAEYYRSISQKAKDILADIEKYSS